MHISEIKSKLKLDPPKFCCDKPLTKKNIDPFENRSFFTVFVGQPRSGKTSHMISALMSKKVYNKVFDHIYVVMPEASRKSLKNNPFKNLKNFKKIIIKKYNYPIELALIKEKQLPCEILGFYTTALFSLNKIFSRKIKIYNIEHGLDSLNNNSVRSKFRKIKRQFLIHKINKFEYIKK